MEHDYDEYYNTKVSRPYGRSCVGYLLGGAMIFISIVEIAFTIADLFHSNFNQNMQQQNIDYVYTWDENPIWPTYGKGLWVGLIVSLNMK
jgi:hypothetical protein